MHYRDLWHLLDDINLEEDSTLNEWNTDDGDMG